MNRKWMMVCLGAVLAAAVLTGCGGNGGTGNTKKPKTDTPPAATAKLGDKTVNLYEFTGESLKGKVYKVPHILVDGDKLYMRYFGPLKEGDTEQVLTANQILLDHETVKEVKPIPGNSNLDTPFFLSNHHVYMDNKGKDRTAWWNGKELHTAKDAMPNAFGTGEGSQVYYWGPGSKSKGKSICRAEIVNGEIKNGKEVLAIPYKDIFGSDDQNKWIYEFSRIRADKDGFYIEMRKMVNKAKEGYKLFAFDNQGKTYCTLENLDKEASVFAITDNYIVMAKRTAQGGKYTVSEKKTGKSLGEFELPAAPDMIDGGAGDSVMIFAGKDEKLYRLDL